MDNRLGVGELGKLQAEALGGSQPLLLSQIEIFVARLVRDGQGELSCRLAAGTDRQTGQQQASS
jgi:hypothetical protein